MKKIVFYFLPFLLLGCSGNNQFNSHSDEKAIISLIKSNLEFLASDELEGREAATRSEKIASQFIAKELQKYGVEPFGDSSTYFQNFDVDLYGIDEQSYIEFNGDEKTRLKNGVDFVRAHYVLPSVFPEALNKEIIFAGYGISSPEDNYDDYKDIDVKGKVVLLLAEVPVELQSTADYYRMPYKIDMAQAKGASGVLIIPGRIAINRWDFYLDRTISKSLIYGKDKTDEKTIPAAMLTVDAATNLLKDEPLTYPKIKELFDNNKKLNSFELKSKVSFNIIVKREKAGVRNVVGIVKGTDPQLSNEYVTIGAHYDHDGIKGGEVYNGANDNASGTTALLEVARQLSFLKSNKRPIVIIFYTAEEKGLIGSKHFAAVSSIISDVIVNINLDMVGSGSSDTLFSVGGGRLSSELAELSNKANDNSAKFIFDYKYDAPDDPERIYYRSDHYSFAKKGIPSIFYTAEDTVNYHKPTDDAVYINFNKIYKVTRLVTNLALEVANLDHRLKSRAAVVTSY